MQALFTQSAEAGTAALEVPAHQIDAPSDPKGSSADQFKEHLTKVGNAAAVRIKHMPRMTYGS